MTIYYMNDESKPLFVRTLDKNGNDIQVMLKPQEAKTFEFEAPENAVPFVKRWDKNILLLSYIVLPA